MAEFPKSGKESSKNKMLKRASCDTGDKNLAKQHKREDYPHQMLHAYCETPAFRDFNPVCPNVLNNSQVASNFYQEFVAGASGVDAERGRRSSYDPNVEISPREKSLMTTHMLDLNFTLPDLNEPAPPEHMSIIDIDGGSNVHNDLSVIAEDLKEIVKIVRKLEIEGYIFENFRLKFLTWYSLYSTAKERDVVRTFVRILNDYPSCLAEQLIDSFSGIINARP